MDEIVYFFESTKYDVVVFEDIDRFENREIIFYKLRELNTILNNSNSIKRRINFVYAVLDDMFDSTERVKFFDYIITVIPVINSLNSYNKLKEYIQPQELLDKLGGNELLNLCDYIQDMRLLLNIVNEFNQFVPLLDPSVMSERILFGLIVYKNYVPSDFSLMYNKEGVVATAIENVDKFRKDLIDDKKLVVEELEDEISKIEDEQDDRIIKLRMSLLEKGHKLSDYSNSNLRIYIDGELHTFDGVAKSQPLFEKIRKGEANFIINGGVRTNIPSFSTIEKDMGGIGYYDSIIDSIRNDCTSRISAIERRIQSVQNEVKSMPSSVHGIYQANPDLLEEDLSPLNDGFKIQLVKFLILNGYLDRHYQYYISYFYPNALKREDRNFVMRAARHEGIQHEVKLDSIDEVLKRFTPNDFENNASLLNVDLVREIYNNQKYASYCHSICKLISSLKNLDFIHLAYKATPPIKNTFFYQLLKTYDYWEEIITYDKDKQDDLREAYIRFCDVRKTNSAFKEWLICNYAFLDKRWDVITTKRMLEHIFKSYTPVFRVLKLTHTPDQLLYDIIENQRYEFSRRNFSAIVRRLGFYELYSSAAYSTLKEVKIPALLHAVENNWERALKAVFPDTSIGESDSSLVEILNKPSIPLPEARAYISKQRSRVAHACQLNDEILNYAFENSLVDATWNNIYYYVQKKKGLPLTFLYNNSIRGKVGDLLSVQEEKDLCRLVVFSNDVKNSKYEELVPLFTTPFEQILNPVSPRRMEFLIENNLLVFDDKNYKFIKDNYHVLSSAFLSKNVDKQTGAFKGNKEELNGLISNLDRAAKAQAAYNSSVELYEKKQETGNKLSEAQAKLAKYTKELAAAQEVANNVKKRSGVNSAEYQAQVKILGRYATKVNAARAEVNTLKKAESDINSQISKNNKVMDNAKVKTSDYQKASDSLKKTMKNLGVETQSSKNALKTLQEKLNNGEITWKAYKDVVDGNYKSVDELNAAIGKLTSKEVSVTAKTSGTDSIDKVKNVIDKLQNKTVNVGTNVNTSGLQKRIQGAVSRVKISPIKAPIQFGITKEQKKILDSLSPKNMGTPYERALKTSGLSKLSDFASKLPTYSTGGFPEDGLFMANHGELVGKFNNGKTAVANNDQITTGFAQAITNSLAPAIYAAVSQAVSENQSHQTGDVYLDGTKLTTTIMGKAEQITRSRGSGWKLA